MATVAAAAWPEQGPARANVPERGTRPACACTVELRFGEVSLLRSATASRRAAAVVPLSMVDAAKIDAVAGDFPALVPRDDTWEGSLTQHRKVIAGHQARWTVAQVVRKVRNTNTEIEATQASEVGKSVEVATLALTAIMRKSQLVTTSDGSKGQALRNAAWTCCPPMLKAVCTPVEGHTGALRNPHADDIHSGFALTGARLRGRSGSGPNGRKPPGAPAITPAPEQLASAA